MKLCGTWKVLNLFTTSFPNFKRFYQTGNQLKSIVLENHVVSNVYRDSIELMALSGRLVQLSGFTGGRVAVMMGTKANLEILATDGLLHKDFPSVRSNDLIVCFETNSGAPEESQVILDEVNNFLNSSETLPDSTDNNSVIDVSVTSIRQAASGVNFDQSSNSTNIALISVAGAYAFAEAKKALARGLNVMLFSDNVPLHLELELKQIAQQRGLLCMGPDCGTGLLNGAFLGFSNKVSRSTHNIGIVGSSGTGVQEVSVLADWMGVGTSNIIGTGGRDLDELIGGITTVQGMNLLSADPDSDVIVLVAKSPSPQAMENLQNSLAECKKPVVAVLLGCNPIKMQNTLHAGKGIVFVPTLEAAAVAAVAIAEGNEVPSKEIVSRLLSKSNEKFKQSPDMNGEQLLNVTGLFTGGTLAKEAKLGLEDIEKKSSITILDLGDDEYTIGKPHPMIDPSTRNQMIKEIDPEVDILLIDTVLGYGSHSNPAGEVAAAVKFANDKRSTDMNGKQLNVIASVTGTKLDDQNYEEQCRILKSAGIFVARSNAKAVQIVSSLVNGNEKLLSECYYDNILDKQLKSLIFPLKVSSKVPTSQSLESTKVFNVGLKQFSKTNHENTYHINWTPPCDGDVELNEMIAALDSDTRVQEANIEALHRINCMEPNLVGVKPAKDMILAFSKGKKKMLLHAGPPIEYSRQCRPMQGAMIGAVLFEGYADSQEEADELLRSGEILTSPCHEHNAVGPMAGVLSESFPVFVVQGLTQENEIVQAYSSLNEGLGQVLRFGAYDSEVIDRLCWMRESLGPQLDLIIQESKPDGIKLNAIIAQALQMGDECHNRNASSTSLFIQELLPGLLRNATKDIDNVMEVTNFLTKNQHSFLNLSMASSKLCLDAGANIPHSSLVTCMARNGVDFGIRVSGTSEKWFTDKAPIVNGLYFPGYTSEDANPDMGDSSITETYGIGGAAMAASPAIVKFVGGNAKEALSHTRQMHQIYLQKNKNFSIPSIDFQGCPMGLDVLSVVDTGIRPIINTGIAHKEAGVGQIGAGITHAPMGVFYQALRDLAEQL
eukprot:g2359.t1